jgi:hypothetical protein
VVVGVAVRVAVPVGLGGLVEVESGPDPPHATSMSAAATRRARAIFAFI